MVDCARHRARRLGIEGRFVVGDARALPFDDGRFDAVILHRTLAVAPDPARIAREASRMLKPGGHVSTFDKFLREGQRPALVRHAVNVFARLLFSDINRAVEPMIAAVGWRVVADEPAGFRGSYRRILAIKPTTP